MKILNLYAGIGGNRKLWGDEHEITAVERDKTISKIYQDFFPDDTVINSNAHKFLIDNYKNYDFIWSSPPCPTHSRMWNLGNIQEGKNTPYPNMQLYQEIIFLQHWFKGKWVVENVLSYYEPLIRPFESENHYFWSNFNITKRNAIKRNITTEIVTKKWGFDLSDYNISKRQKNKLLSNMVNPYLGLHILNCAFKVKQHTLKNVA